jgi:hypothetical protein
MKRIIKIAALENEESLKRLRYSLMIISKGNRIEFSTLVYHRPRLETQGKRLQWKIQTCTSTPTIPLEHQPLQKREITCRHSPWCFIPSEKSSLLWNRWIWCYWKDGLYFGKKITFSIIWCGPNCQSSSNCSIFL